MSGPSEPGAESAGTHEQSRRRATPAPFRRPPSAVGLLGLGVLLLLLGVALPRLAFLGPVVLLAGWLALVVGGVLVVLATRRMALGLEAVYDHLDGGGADAATEGRPRSGDGTRG